PHVDDTVTFNGRLDPTNSTWMKISDCAMVLEEQPAKLAEAFRLFLQGEGYATPLTTPASSPCGTKYLSYSNIFFANFKEEQERILADKLKRQQQQQQQQQQPTTRLRTNTRLCRETAINNNNNNNNDCNSYSTTMNMDYEEAEQEEEEEENRSSSTVMDNGNVQINETANILYEHHVDGLDNIDEEQEEECSLKKHTINGTLYANAAATTNTNTTVQSKKIRITENPLPEPVSC
ncbi:hypothetical protein DOY81_010920, partial [Sarcophaga bullata]